MVVQAYILIQTEVGKAATRRRADRRHLRRHPRRGRHRPLRRHRPRRGPQRRRARQARHRQDPGRPGHHPHPDLHGRPRLSRRPRTAHVGPACTAPRRAVRSAPLVLVAALAAAGLRARGGGRSRRGPSAPCAAAAARGRRPSAATRAVDTAARRPPPCAAWGDPADHRPLRARPARRRRPTTASTVNGVDWVVRAAQRRRRLHDLRPRPRRSRCWCPGAYGPEPLLLPAFTEAARGRSRRAAATAAAAADAGVAGRARRLSAGRSGARRASWMQLVDQLGVVQARGRPHPRVHRVRA